MQGFIQRFKYRTDAVTFQGHFVPYDHQETVFNQHVWVALAVMLLGWLTLALMFPHVPDDRVLMLPMALVVGLGYGCARLFYIERMHHLIKRWRPSSFHLPVAPAF